MRRFSLGIGCPCGTHRPLQEFELRGEIFFQGRLSSSAAAPTIGCSRSKQVRSSGLRVQSPARSSAQCREQDHEKRVDSAAQARANASSDLCWRSLARTATPAPFGLPSVTGLTTRLINTSSSRAQFLSDPLELGFHLLRLRIKKHVGKQRDCCAQAPKSDPHLVQSLWIAA